MDGPKGQRAGFAKIEKPLPSQSSPRPFVYKVFFDFAAAPDYL